MLRRPSPAIQHCQNRAAECEHLAVLASNPETKNGYLRLADCWHGLAGNHEFAERLDIFLGISKKKTAAKDRAGAIVLDKATRPPNQLKAAPLIQIAATVWIA